MTDTRYVKSSPIFDRLANVPGFWMKTSANGTGIRPPTTLTSKPHDHFPLVPPGWCVVGACGCYGRVSPSNYGSKRPALRHSLPMNFERRNFFFRSLVLAGIMAVPASLDALATPAKLGAPAGTYTSSYSNCPSRADTLKVVARYLNWTEHQDYHPAHRTTCGTIRERYRTLPKPRS